MEELRSIHKHQTWTLVPKPADKKIIAVKWIYRTKYNADGTVNKLKARLVAKGFIQQARVNYGDTFAPLARLDTIKLLLAVATQQNWLVHHLDVKSAFLNGEL